MGFYTYILLITYSMELLGLWAISLIEPVGFGFVAVISAAAAASLPFNLKKRRFLPGFLWNAAALMLIAMFVLDYAAYSKDLLISGARFLAILSALKLFDLRKNRDYVIAYGLVFFQILASAASTVSPAFFVILALFVVSGIWAMTIFNIKKDWEEANGKEGYPNLSFGAPFFLTVIITSIVSMVITLALFFIIPRVSAGFLERKATDTLKVSGFSDKVELGAIGPVKTDPTIVMRVGLKEVPREVIYFRGATLDRYDGVSWSKTVKDRYRINRGEDGLYRLGPRSKGRLIEQEILLEPLDTDYVFAASALYAIEGQFPDGTRMDGSGSFRLPFPLLSRIGYKALSVLSKDSAGEVLPQYLEASYLEKSGEAEKIRSLAASVTKGASADIEKAEAIEEHLRSGYAYSLDPGGSSSTPLEDFLFRTKKGYCEHYATAMVMLLRLEGIPARLVTGFLHGEWNSLGGYLIVRQQDSHSWVEAYIQGRGWVRFDPTPAAIGVFNKPSMLSLYLDLMKWRWNRYIIHYSFADQQKLASTVEGNTYRMFMGLKRYLTLSGMKGRLSPLIPALFIVAALLAALLFVKKRSGYEKGPKTPDFYLQMLKTLKTKGFVRGSSETAQEFAERVSDDRVRRITIALHERRYGGFDLDEARLTEVKKDIEGLKKGR